MKKIVIIIIILILAIIVTFVYTNNSRNEENNNVNAEEEIEEIEEIEENEENNEISENNSEETINIGEAVGYVNYATNITDAEIIQVAFPTGFMGSSLYRVVLFSTGDVYIQKFDGEDKNIENIVSEELIAKGATSISSVEEEEDSKYGKVIIYGGTEVSSEYGWVEFE